MRRVSWILAFSLMVVFPGLSQAQNTSQMGVGFQLLGSTANNNVGPGIHFRASTALNRDISLGVGSGFTGFIFRGRDDAAFALNPQVSIIVSFSSLPQQTNYVLGGGGAYVPFGNIKTESGPTFNLGIGRAWLLQESSIFFEFNPGLLIGKESTTLVLPLRAGVIF